MYQVWNERSIKPKLIKVKEVSSVSCQSMKNYLLGGKLDELS
ncbi:hypothetical protein ACTUJ1_20230 [Priestia flexa]